MSLDGGGVVEPCQHHTGSVVDHADENQFLAAALQPVVNAGIQLHQLAEAGPTGPARAVRFAVALSLPQPLIEQPAAKGFRANLQAVFGLELFRGKGRTEVPIVAGVGVENRLAESLVGAVIGRLAAQAVNDDPVALVFESHNDAANLADAEAK